MKRILIVAMVAASAWGQGGNISGRVLDERGRDYAQGARVLAVLLPEKPEGFTPFVTNAVTTPEGRFQMVGLPVGKYELFVQALNTDYVDMCRWGRVVQDLNREVAEAESSKGIKMRVEGLKKLEVGR